MPKRIRKSEKSSFPGNLTKHQKIAIKQLIQGYPSWMINGRLLASFVEMGIFSFSDGLSREAARTWLKLHDVEPVDLDIAALTLDNLSPIQLGILKWIIENDCVPTGHAYGMHVYRLMSKQVLIREDRGIYFVKPKILEAWPKWAAANPEAISQSRLPGEEVLGPVVTLPDEPEPCEPSDLLLALPSAIRKAVLRLPVASQSAIENKLQGCYGRSQEYKEDVLKEIEQYVYYCQADMGGAA